MSTRFHYCVPQIYCPACQRGMDIRKITVTPIRKYGQADKYVNYLIEGDCPRCHETVGKIISYDPRKLPKRY